MSYLVKRTCGYSVSDDVERPTEVELDSEHLVVCVGGEANDVIAAWNASIEGFEKRLAEIREGMCGSDG